MDFRIIYEAIHNMFASQKRKIKEHSNWKLSCKQIIKKNEILNFGIHYFAIFLF